MKLVRRKIVVKSHEGAILSVSTAYEHMVPELAQKAASVIPGSEFVIDADGDGIVTRPPALELEKLEPLPEGHPDRITSGPNPGDGGQRRVRR